MSDLDVGGVDDWGFGPLEEYRTSALTEHVEQLRGRMRASGPVVDQALAMRCGEVERVLAIRNARATRQQDEREAEHLRLVALLELEERITMVAFEAFGTPAGLSAEEYLTAIEAGISRLHQEREAAIASTNTAIAGACAEVAAAGARALEEQAQRHTEYLAAIRAADAESVTTCSDAEIDGAG